MLWGKKEDAMYELLFFLCAMLTPEQKIILDQFMDDRRKENGK
jgi:hypothetical protein